jgi:hypothetical protein
MWLHAEIAPKSFGTPLMQKAKPEEPPARGFVGHAWFVPNLDGG